MYLFRPEPPEPPVVRVLMRKGSETHRIPLKLTEFLAGRRGGWGGSGYRSWCQGMPVACCLGHNFIIVTVAKPKMSPREASNCDGSVASRARKTCQLSWSCLPWSVCRLLGRQAPKICGWRDDVICFQQLAVISTPSPPERLRLLP